MYKIYEIRRFVVTIWNFCGKLKNKLYLLTKINDYLYFISSA